VLEEERGGGRKGGEEDAHLVSLWRMKAHEVSSKTKDEGFKASSSHLKANESSFKDFLIGVDATRRLLLRPVPPTATLASSTAKRTKLRSTLDRAVLYRFKSREGLRAPGVEP